MGFRSLLLVILIASVLSGQTIVEHQFAVPLPLSGYVTNPSPVFPGQDAVAIAGDGELHWITGLPDSPVQHAIPLSGPFAVGGSWAILSPSVGSYASVSGELILVRGLPHAPTLTNTGFIHPTTPWIVVNDHTAVAVDRSTQQFHILRHGQGTATVTAIPSSTPLSDGAYTWGRVDDDGVMGLGAGFDGVSGTYDDEIVLLSGLAGPVGSAVVSQTAIPTGSMPQGFVVSESGVGALWEDLDWIPSASVDVTLVRRVSFGLELDTLTIPVSPGLPFPGTPWGGVVKSRGDGFLLRVRDIYPVEWGYTLIKNLSTIPVIAGTFATQGPLILGENEIALTGEYGGPQLFLTSFDGTAPVSASIVAPGDVQFAMRPNSQSVLTFSASYGPEAGFVTFSNDPFGASVTLHQGLEFTMVPPHITLPVILGPGRVAWFTLDWTSGTPATGISVITLPINTTLGALDPYDGWLSAWPALPTVDDDLMLQTVTYPTPQDVFVFISPALLPVPATVPGIYRPLVIDPNVAFPPVVLPNNGSWLNQVVLPLSSLPAGLRGVPLYLQGVRNDFGLQLSQTLILSIG